MKFPVVPRLADAEKVSPPFYKTLTDLLGDMGVALNGLLEGRINVINNATTAAPTQGNYQVGDFVKNSAPSELGSAPNKYVIEGWMCTVSSPLTFVEKRFLTGN